MAPKTRSKGPASPIRTPSAASPPKIKAAVPRKTTKVVKKKATATPKRKQRKLGKSDSANARANKATTAVFDEDEDEDEDFHVPTPRLDAGYPFDVKIPRTLLSAGATTARAPSSCSDEPTVDWDLKVETFCLYYPPYAEILKADKATSDAIQGMLQNVRRLAAAGDQEKAERVFENAKAHIDSHYRAQQEGKAFSLVDGEESDYDDFLSNAGYPGIASAKPHEATQYVSIERFRALLEIVGKLWEFVKSESDRKVQRARRAAIDEMVKMEDMWDMCETDETDEMDEMDETDET